MKREQEQKGRRDWAKMFNVEEGKRALIVACGPSTQHYGPYRETSEGCYAQTSLMGPKEDWELDPELVVIGVNDGAGWLGVKPRYCVILDCLAAPVRTRKLVSHLPDVMFHLTAHWPKPEWNVEVIDIFSKGSIVPIDYKELRKGKLPVGSSTRTAFAVAHWLGCTEVGVIGMDYNVPGHALFADKSRYIHLHARDAALLAGKGTRFYNLSPCSLVEGIEHRDFVEFVQCPATQPSDSSPPEPSSSS